MHHAVSCRILVDCVCGGNPRKLSLFSGSVPWRSDIRPFETPLSSGFLQLRSLGRNFLRQVLTYLQNAYLRHGLDAPSRDRTLRLSYKTNAIRELNREIQALQDIASDGLLLAIITMATHGSGEQLDPPQREESLSALESVQNFQYYGRMRWEAAHLKAVCHLVYQRGGLHTVKMPGLANAIRL